MAVQAKAAGIKQIPQLDRANEVGALAKKLKASRDTLVKHIAKAEHMHDKPEECARLVTSAGADAIADVRASCDALEVLVADDMWPLPKYREMLFPV